jgi:hypothetical protein
MLAATCGTVIALVVIAASERWTGRQRLPTVSPGRDASAMDPAGPKSQSDRSDPIADTLGIG